MKTIKGYRTISNKFVEFMVDGGYYGSLPLANDMIPRQDIIKAIGEELGINPDRIEIVSVY